MCECVVDVVLPRCAIYYADDDGGGCVVSCFSTRAHASHICLFRQRLGSTAAPSLMEAVAACLMELEELGIPSLHRLLALRLGMFALVSQEREAGVHLVDLEACHLVASPPEQLGQIHHVASSDEPFPARGWGFSPCSPARGWAWPPGQQGGLVVLQVHDPVNLFAPQVVVAPLLQGSVVEPLPRLRLSHMPIKTYLFSVAFCSRQWLGLTSTKLKQYKTSHWHTPPPQFKYSSQVSASSQFF